MHQTCVERTGTSKVQRFGDIQIAWLQSHTNSQDNQVGKQRNISCYPNTGQV